MAVHADVLANLSRGVNAKSYSGNYSGRMYVKAPKLKASFMKELLNEGPTLVTLEKAITKIIRRYLVSNPGLDKVMIARTNLLAAFGQLAVKIGKLWRRRW